MNVCHVLIWNIMKDMMFILDIIKKRGNILEISQFRHNYFRSTQKLITLVTNICFSPKGKSEKP